MFKWLLILHVLGASIWIGGHLILCLRYLPEALRKRNPEIIKAFEKKYEIVGLPSLLLLSISNRHSDIILATAVTLTLNYIPGNG